MQTQVFLEGRNGGRTIKASDTWKCIKYDNHLPDVTFGTPQGAIRIVLSQDERTGAICATVELKPWAMDDTAKSAGISRLIYSGPIG